MSLIENKRVRARARRAQFAGAVRRRWDCCTLGLIQVFAFELTSDKLPLFKSIA